MILTNPANQDRWRRDARLGDRIMRSRLDGFSGLARTVMPTDTEKPALRQR